MNNSNQIWKLSILAWGLLALSIVLIYLIFQDGVHAMFSFWDREEYSHAPLIPFISAFFIWQMKDRLEKIPFSISYLGSVIVVFGLLIGVIGNLSTIYTIVQYAALIVLAGLALSLVGRNGFRLIMVPLLILIFMVPLRDFFYFSLSQKLQLVSSAIGVEVTRMFGVSVFLEGNVIDLGNYKLQVVDACSGLRYLFPLMSFGFICAYLFKAPLWQRVLVFLSTIPITVFMNSFRIGVIGVLVDRWGTEQAEGFLHDFEGWVIFMACVTILFAEMWLLNRVFNRGKRSFREVFGLEFPEPSSKDAEVHVRPIPKPFIISLIILVVAMGFSFGKEERKEIIPDRVAFSSFPDQLGVWQGKKDVFDAGILSGLAGMTDYTIGDYIDPDNNKVNFYVAYYESQKNGGAIHSPKTCIPGGGWLINEIIQVPLEGVLVDGKPVMVNRVEIAKGDYKQLVYYWFQQRGRSITNEYLLKWFLFWDSLTMHRSDGALVRLTTTIMPNEEWEVGDQRLKKFAQSLGSELKEYIPE